MSGMLIEHNRKKKRAQVVLRKKHTQSDLPADGKRDLAHEIQATDQQELLLREDQESVDKKAKRAKQR